MALTVILLTSSLSIGRAFFQLMAADRGFDARGIVTVNVSLDGTTHQTNQQRLQYFEEVLARVRALLRRSAGHAKSEFNCGPVRLDTRTGRVSVNGNPVKLTSHEYRLLAYLMHHTGRVVSRTELVEHLYDQDFDRDSNTIEVFVGRIRKKLGVEIIQTVRGLGYLLTPPDAR